MNDMTFFILLSVTSRFILARKDMDANEHKIPHRRNSPTIQYRKIIDMGKIDSVTHIYTTDHFPGTSKKQWLG